MADGQRMRWWQDEDRQTQAAQTAAERVAATPRHLPETVDAPALMAEPAESGSDTWAELEAEALRRATQSEFEEAQPVSVVVNKTTVRADGYRRAKLFRTLALFQAFVFLGLAGLLLYIGLFLHKPDYFRFLMSEKYKER